MIIDQNAIDNLNFSLNTNEQSDIENTDNNVTSLIHKYHIVSTTNHLIDSLENNYLFLINHITDLYYLSKPIPEDIQNTLKHDIEFKTFLLNDLDRRLKNIVSNNSTLFFKEIGNIINLLSLGNQYNIFETYNTYNLDQVSKIFRDYEAFLVQQNNNIELFDLSFKCYLTLIEAFTQLCIINSTDIQRKKTIQPIVERLTETNNMLKFTVTLDEKKIDKLNNILGKLLYYFSHIPYYEVKEKSIDYVIDEFTLNLERLCDGYNLSKDTNFGNNPSHKQKEFIQFKNNGSLLILILIKKLENNFEEQDFINSKNFNKLLELYYDGFLPTSNKKTYNHLDDFKKILLDSLIFNYIPYNKDLSELFSHEDVIDNFILAGEDYQYNNLETIHNILLFSKLRGLKDNWPRQY